MSILTILPFLLLLLAVLGLWVHPRAWLALLTIAAGLGYYTGALQGLAIVWMVAAAALALAYTRARAASAAGSGRGRQMIAGVAFFLFALAMAIPVLPGFTRVELVPAQLLSADAAPYALSVGFPKVTVGILVLGIINPQTVGVSGLGSVLKRALPVFVVTTVVVMVFALAIGYTRLAPRWTELFLIWAPVNLLFTCLAEEAFFRGFVQKELSAGRSRGALPMFAWLAAALLFGLAHFAGGPVYVIAGALAGLGYGWAFHVTGRVEAAMLVHFGVNATHFLCFVYPRLA